MRLLKFACALSTALIPAVACAGVPAHAGPPSTTRIVIGFRPTASAAASRGLEQSLGLSSRATVGAVHADIADVPSGRAASVLQALRGQPSVKYAEVDTRAVPTDVTPNDPYWPTGTISGGEWGPQLVGAPTAWTQTTGSSNVVVAVVDSGVVATQPDLAPVLVPGWNVLTGTSDTSDTYGHGTEVAGVAVAASNNARGVAAYCWNCRLMPVKVYGSSSAYDSDIAKGITWAVDHGADVINVSLAGTSSSSVLASAVSYAQQHNVVVVAAAGNNGNSTPTYPASLPGVISVAASDQSDALYSYSDYGSWVDVAAPGSTPTTLPNGAYGAVGGTSIASPAVAGIAALELSANPSATAAQVTDALFRTTDPIAGSRAVAYGRVDAARAVAAIGSGSGSAPSPSPVPVLTPSLASAPTVSGSAVSGQTLTARTGSWANNPTSYAYQWQRCDSSGVTCTAVAGATTSAFAVTSADVGSMLEVSVTASNGGGSATGTSAPTALVVAGSTSATFSGSLTPKATSVTYSVKAGAGGNSAALSYSKCASLTLTVRDGSGSLLAQGTGPSVLKVNAALPAGTSSWTVSGSCRTSFTLSVSAPAA